MLRNAEFKQPETIRACRPPLPGARWPRRKRARRSALVQFKGRVELGWAPAGEGRKPVGCVELAMTHRSASRCVFATHPTCWRPGNVVCPQGHRLSDAGKASKQKNNGESVPLEVYQAKVADCGGCPLRDQCVQSKSGARSVRRRPHEEHVEALKERMKSPEAKTLYRQRSQTVERSFADQKEHRGLRKFSGRGQERAAVQAGLSILVHNLRTLDKLRSARDEVPADAEKNAA